MHAKCSSTGNTFINEILSRDSPVLTQAGRGLFHMKMSVENLESDGKHGPIKPLWGKCAIGSLLSAPCLQFVN